MIETLIEKARQNNLEVEDILSLVTKKQPKSIIEGLQRLKLEISSSLENNNSIPFEKWITAVTIFFEGGYSRLVNTAIKDKNFSSFAISVLEETKSYEGFKSLLRIMNESKLNTEIGYQNILNSISAINFMISFDNNIVITPADAESARNMIHDFLNFNKEHNYKESDVVIAYCALRRIGNAETIALIKKMPRLTKSENAGIDTQVKNEIKKRIFLGESPL